MAAAAARKLLKEIETTLKKVDDGIEEFNILWEEAQDSSTAPSQRDKLGDELKKSINKLQRFRVQIREWIAASEVKIEIKDKLEKARKEIEFNMQRFKEFERELKTKAYSTFALAKDDEDDDSEKREHKEWCANQINSLNDSIELLEADIETLNGAGKKSLSGRDKEEVDDKKKHIERHRWHILKLESLLRSLDNDTVGDLGLVVEIKESVEYYIEAFFEPEYYHDECLYDALHDEVTRDYAAEMEVAASKNDKQLQAEPEKFKVKNPKNTGQKAIAAKKAACQNPALQAGNQGAVVRRRRVFGNDEEQKVGEDQLLPGDSNSAEEFICKICYVHIVGCEPKLTKCSHLFCGDCLAQWFEQHPEIQTWAQRAKTAGGAEHTVPCPVCKTQLIEKKDLYPVCAAATQSENLLLWRMLSSLKVMCANHSRVTPGENCTWIGEYGEYQDHIRDCKSEPLASSSTVECIPALPQANISNGKTQTQSQSQEAVTTATTVPATVTVTQQAAISANSNQKTQVTTESPAKSTPSRKKTSDPIQAVTAQNTATKNVEQQNQWNKKNGDKSAPPQTAMPKNQSAKFGKPQEFVKSASSTAEPTTQQQPLKGQQLQKGGKNPTQPQPHPLTSQGKQNNLVGKNNSQQHPGAKNSSSNPEDLNTQTVSSVNGNPENLSAQPQNNIMGQNPMGVSPGNPNVLQQNGLQKGPSSASQAGGQSGGTSNVVQSGLVVAGAGFGHTNPQTSSKALNASSYMGNPLSTGAVQTQSQTQSSRNISTSYNPLRSSYQQHGCPSSRGSQRNSFPYGLAKAPFEPRGENTIGVAAGNRLKIIEKHSSGWTFVKNDDTGESGWVPAWVVSEERPAVQRTPPPKMMRALANFDGNSENELTIQKGELLDVVERHETGWTFGKKVDSTILAEGWFPDWVIQTPQNHTTQGLGPGFAAPV